MEGALSEKSFGDAKGGSRCGGEIWPRITPRSLRLTCAVHSAVQCRRQLWATAQLWETLPVDPRSSGLQTQRIARCNRAEYSDEVLRHVSLGGNRVCLYMYISFFIYVDCNCILYLRVCMPDIFRYGMCIKTTGTPCEMSGVRQRSTAIEDSSSRARFCSTALDILRESTFQISFNDTRLYSIKPIHPRPSVIFSAARYSLNIDSRTFNWNCKSLNETEFKFAINYPCVWQKYHKIQIKVVYSPSYLPHCESVPGIFTTSSRDSLSD